LHKINQGPAFGTLPTLWIHGDNDRLVVMEESEITLNLLKGNDFEVLINPGGQHENFNEINKDEIISKVCAFIDRVLENQ